MILCQIIYHYLFIILYRIKMYSMINKLLDKGEKINSSKIFKYDKKLNYHCYKVVKLKLDLK